MATFEEFMNIDIRIGRVLSVENFPEAKKSAYKLKVDFGSEIGVKQTSAQITMLYSNKDLIGRLVAAVVNFPPKNIAGFRSEVLLLGAVCDDGKVMLLKPDPEAPVGSRIG